MEIITNPEELIKKVDQYSRLAPTDTNDKIRDSAREILQLWPQVVAAGTQANNDELFDLNISRVTLNQVLQILSSKHFFNQDQSLIREIFFAGFNVIVDNESIFQNNASKYILSNVRFMLQFTSNIVSRVLFTQDDLSTDNEQKLLIAMREHIDQTSVKDDLTQDIISLVWNSVDKTIVVPAFLKAGYAKSVVEWIIDRENKFDGYLIDSPVHILHNLARHDDGIDQLNSYNAMDVIDQLKIAATDEESVYDMIMLIAMIRALLTDKDKIKFDAQKYPERAVNMLVNFAIETAKASELRYSGFHLSEPLTVLVKLFYIDEILDNTISNNQTNPSLIDLLVDALNKLYPKISYNKKIMENYTCVVILNLLWLISNHKKYHDMIRDNDQLMDRIKNAAKDEETFINTTMPRSMKSIKEAANDIIDNLDKRN